MGRVLGFYNGYRMEFIFAKGFAFTGCTLFQPVSGTEQHDHETSKTILHLTSDCDLRLECFFTSTSRACCDDPPQNAVACADVRAAAEISIDVNCKPSHRCCL
jgi:hypothetical protein